MMKKKTIAIRYFLSLIFVEICELSIHETKKKRFAMFLLKQWREYSIPATLIFMYLYPEYNKYMYI